jgi:hypothetical protein
MGRICFCFIFWGNIVFQNIILFFMSSVAVCMCIYISCFTLWWSMLVVGIDLCSACDFGHEIYFYEIGLGMQTVILHSPFKFMCLFLSSRLKISSSKSLCLIHLFYPNNQHTFSMCYMLMHLATKWESLYCAIWQLMVK